MKLFDLAAISIGTDQDLIPAFNKTQYYTFDRLKKDFQPNAVDPYVFKQDAILTKRTTPEEQEKLWYTWFDAVLHHPFIYAKHRFVNLSYCLTGRVGYTHVDTVLSKVMTPGTELYSMTKNVIDIIGYIFFSQIIIIALGFIYFIASILYWKRSILAPIIFAFTLPALLLVAILFVMSMAGTPRYTFFSIVMIHGCHLFALGLYQAIRKSGSVMMSGN